MANGTTRFTNNYDSYFCAIPNTISENGNSSLHSPANSVIEITNEMPRRWGRLSAPHPLPAIDSPLAAKAIEHGLTLAMRNTRGPPATATHELGKSHLARTLHRDFLKEGCMDFKSSWQQR
jgi:hypothetical protein